MLIVNENADFSACGLGQIKYQVSNAVKELLQSAYSMVTREDMVNFQSFIDDIGGLTGTIWSKMTDVFIYSFACNVDEAKINLINGNEVPFRPSSGGTNSLSCVKGQGVKLLSGGAWWPYSYNSRTSKPFGLAGVYNAVGNCNIAVVNTESETYRAGGTRVYTTSHTVENSIVLPNNIINKSIAVSFQSESSITIVTDGVNVPNYNTTACPISNNTADSKDMNVARLYPNYNSLFNFVGWDLTKEETLQIAVAANKWLTK